MLTKSAKNTANCNYMVSIALASYNGEKYIKEQLDSILNQTYSDFELIVCDDCSADSTTNIVKDYCAKDKRITLYINERRLGVNKNFEKAILLCSGEYIALSDQDDIWLPNHLEKLLEIIKGHKLACGNSELIDKNGNSMAIKLNEIEELYTFNDSDNLLYKLICSRNPFQGASMLMHRSFINQVIPIPDNIPYHDTWFALNSCFIDRIQYTFDVITLYRQHKGQRTQRKKRTAFQRFLYTFKRTVTRKKCITDRFEYLDEIKKRYTISEKQAEIINNCTTILNMKKEKYNLIKTIKLYWSVYDYIFTHPNHKYRIRRTIKNVILKWK